MANGWAQNDLTGAAAAPNAGGEPWGYVFSNQGTQHVNYCSDPDAHIHELWWDANGWHHNDLTSLTGAPATASNPRGYMFDAQGTQHVNYRGADNHIHELWWDAGGWHHNDLTTAASAPDAAGDPYGYTFDAQGTQHVNYRSADNHIHELWWDANGWHHNDLTTAASAPNAIGDPYGYMFDAQGTQHVNYRGADNHIHELWWDANGWHHNDLSAATGAPGAASDPRGYMFDAQGTQHVNYRSADNHIHELWWDANGWHHNDLTTAAASNANAIANPRGYMFDGQGTQHVNYIASDGHIHELWWASCSRYLGLNEQHQEQTEWCWSATSVSISLFYNAASAWTQCSLVNNAFGQTTCCQNGSSSACNQPWYPDKALTITGNLKSMDSSSESLSRVMTEIDAGRPISIGIYWFGGGGHNPAIDGYDNCNSAAPTIDIQDPWYGPSTQDFNTFPSTYNGGASWGTSYFTT